MINLKSHFILTKQERNGIFLLAFIIIAIQFGYYFLDFSSEPVPFNKRDYELYSREIDSLRQIEIELRKKKLYPFNPNYIDDFKGCFLGMSNEEIDRLLAFRKEDQWISSVEQFQQVTKISDSLLGNLAPYFKFPDWITNQKGSTINTNSNPYLIKKEEKIDLNKATAEQLQSIKGIGKVLSERIIKYRNRFPDGFMDLVELNDVYGLSSEVIESIRRKFTVTPSQSIEKVDLNKATLTQLVKIRHISYDLAFSILEERALRDGFNTLDELKKVRGFPINKLEIIKLYLSLENIKAE